MKLKNGNVDYTPFEDHRGTHTVHYNSEMAGQGGFRDIKQVFSTINKKGTVRAFHYQGKTMNKIVRALAGRFDLFVVNLDTETVREYRGYDNRCQPVYVGENELLGYISLVNDSVMNYLVDEDFDAETNFGYSPFSYGVEWPVIEGLMIMSERDALAEVDSRTFKLIDGYTGKAVVK